MNNTTLNTNKLPNMNPSKNNMKNNYSKFRQYVVKHKKTSIAVAIILILVIYEIYKALFPASTVTTYVVEEVQKGSIVTNVTGSGQVSASNQITLQAKSSGNILKINATTGQTVKEGQVIAQIDNPSAYLDLQSAQIAYQKLVQPADSSTLIQAQNDLNSTKQSLAKSTDDLNNAYDSGYTNVASSYLDLSDAISGANDMLYSSGGYLTDINLVNRAQGVKSLRSTAGDNFDSAKRAYESALSAYRSSSRTNSQAQMDQLIKSTYDITKQVSSALKDLKNTIDYIKSTDPSVSSTASNTTLTQETTAATNLSTWLGKINSDLSNLSNSMNTISDLKNTIQNGPQTIAQKQASLDKITSGANNLDVQSQQISLSQAQLTYQNTFIKAPFDGVIAQITAKPSDAISSGTSIGTIITKNNVADITVNEVDAAKIAAGQKAVLTFDAIDGLEISGVVQSIDLIGTVTQGVVNYNVKITFDVQDDRVKSGMSVSASIITNNKQDVVVVPNSAVKIKNGTQYVEVFSANVPLSSTPEVVSETPIQQTVQVGLSNDTSTEITSGVSVGDRIITKTTTASATAAKTSAAPSLFGSGGNRGGTTGGGSGSVIRTGGGGAPAGR